jgi:hypothetical protein
MKPLGNRHSDSSHTDDPKSLALELLSEEFHGLPIAPLELFDIVDRWTEASTSRKDQPDGDVSRRVGQDSRGVAHLDRAGFGGSNVDVVVADGKIGDPAQFLARRIHNLRIDRIAQDREDPRTALYTIQQDLARRRILAGPNIDRVMLSQAVDADRGYTACYEDFSHEETLGLTVCKTS